jgi:hypothetical protein
MPSAPQLLEHTPSDCQGAKNCCGMCVIRYSLHVSVLLRTKLLQGISCVFHLTMDRPVQIRLHQCQSSLHEVAV